LRETRQAQGLHIAALAASIKVAQKKLEALEGDRFAELPDATFTRALAQTVCRALKIDPAPVLALLPAPSGHRLEQVGEGINAPFRDRPGRREPSDWSSIGRPAIWGPLLLLLAAAVVYFLPSGWLANLQQLPSPQAASAPAASEPTSTSTSSVMMAPPPVVEVAPAPAGDAASNPAASTSASAPTSSLLPGAAGTVTAAKTITAPQPAPTAASAQSSSDTKPAGALQVRAIAESWVEVRDSRAKVLIARTVQAGETVAIDGDAPLRIKIGNARATVVSYRGQALDLAANTQNNVARVELK
jgi:cytoskeleton protein RodZ